MRESNVISNVITKLPKIIHTQSMTFGSRSFNGTPDRYFDGPARDLWAEFKYVDAIPREKAGELVDSPAVSTARLRIADHAEHLAGYRRGMAETVRLPGRVPGSHQHACG